MTRAIDIISAIRAQQTLGAVDKDELLEALVDIAIALAYRKDVPPHEILREVEKRLSWPESEWPNVRENIALWVGDDHG